jgi:tRNA (guanine26-N2/guanine27-N2)-dimethyltransferase
VEFPFPVVEMTEGAAHLLVPDVPRRRGPATAGPWPFYNPTMVVNRDLSAIILEKWPRPLASVLDGLAATGAWGIRMALEAGVRDITFTERSSVAVDLIRENLRRNDLVADIEAGDVRRHLARAGYDFVDIDPFGPPTPFLPAVFDAPEISRGIGVTATDTAVLCGTYPEACRRRYDAQPMRCPQGAEIGLRILVGYCARLAAARGKSIRPILAFAAEHFVRILLTVETGSRPATLGRVVRAGPSRFAPVSAAARDSIGPLWLGPLSTSEVLRKLGPTAWTSVGSARLLASLQAESDMPPFFVTTDELAAQERGSPPKLERFIAGLREIGYRATRTHFHPRGVKTDAPPEDVARVFRDRATSGSRDDSTPAS